MRVLFYDAPSFRVNDLRIYVRTCITRGLQVELTHHTHYHELSLRCRYLHYMYIVQLHIYLRVIIGTCFEWADKWLQTYITLVFRLSTPALGYIQLK